MGALGGHRHDRRGAGLSGRQKLGDQGFQRLRALGRGRLVGGEGGKRPQRRRQRHGRKAAARSARAGADGVHCAACSVERGRSELRSSLFQILRRRATNCALTRGATARPAQPHRAGKAAGDGAFRRLHPGDARLHRLLHLLEGAHLDLPHPLARHAESVGAPRA